MASSLLRRWILEILLIIAIVDILPLISELYFTNETGNIKQADRG